MIKILMFIGLLRTSLSFEFTRNGKSIRISGDLTINYLEGDFNILPDQIVKLAIVQNNFLTFQINTSSEILEMTLFSGCENMILMYSATSIPQVVVNTTGDITITADNYGIPDLELLRDGKSIDLSSLSRNQSIFFEHATEFYGAVICLDQGFIEQNVSITARTYEELIETELSDNFEDD